MFDIHPQLETRNSPPLPLSPHPLPPSSSHWETKLATKIATKFTRPRHPPPKTRNPQLETLNFRHPLTL